MKYFWHKIAIAIAVITAMAATACSDNDEPKFAEGETIYPTLRVSVSEMEMNQVSRALSPMSPDIEKYVKTIAIFEFDNEKMHINGSDTYHFIDFIEGTVDGVKNVGTIKKTDFGIVETSLEGLKFKSYNKGILCLVANVTQDQVDDYYTECHKRHPELSSGQMSFDDFQDWQLEFEYETKENVAYDETVSGHIKTMYMFGYYRGEISADKPESISIDLGRLASRIDMTIINETGAEIDKRLGYHFDNVCHSAYFFPIKKSPPPTIDAGISRTVICSGPEEVIDAPELPETFPDKGRHTRYFYAAAHSAKDEDEATKIHLFWNSKILGNDEVDPEGKDIKIPLCNVIPTQASSVVNGYSLSRNTRYGFIIHLKSKPSAVVSRSWYADENNPGEITVYLP